MGKPFEEQRDEAFCEWRKEYDTVVDVEWFEESKLEATWDAAWQAATERAARVAFNVGGKYGATIAAAIRGSDGP